jgi:hypothetical protein
MLQYVLIIFLIHILFLFYYKLVVIDGVGK